MSAAVPPSSAPPAPVVPVRIPAVREHVVALLVVIATGADAVLALLAAGLNTFRYAQELYAYLGAAIWLAVGVTNAAALVGLVRSRSWWANATVAGQLMALGLIGYLVKADLGSPETDPSWMAVLAVHAAVSLVVLVTAFRHATHLSRMWTSVIALFPLLALFQLWLTNDYAPRSLNPNVSVTTEMSEAGKDAAGNTLMTATVTVANSGGRAAAVIGGDIRVVAGPDTNAAPQQPAEADVIDALDWVAPDKDTFPRRPPSAQTDRLVYFDELLYPDNLLPPGVTISSSQLVTIPAYAGHNVRMTVDLGTANSSRLGLLRSCQDGTAATDPAFEVSMRQVMDAANGTRWVCADREIKPQTLTEALLGDDPVLRSYLFTAGPPEPRQNYPVLTWLYGTPKSMQEADAELFAATAGKIARRNPAIFITVVKEARV